MVTEPIELIIRERGAAATSRKIDGVGKSSRTAAKAVGALVAALGAIVAVRALKGLAEDAIAAAAAFEGYEVRLRGLLGSQEEANKALQTFVDLSSSTPFAVADIVEGATALASAALGNRQRLEELTQTAANLAAVSGLSFAEAASNLARSLQAGIGAADLFRERGVRALIEEIAGIPDATKLTAQELDAAFQQVFGNGGTFGDAAEQLSLTLGGALSNIGDAAANFKVELGSALSPTVINAARQIFIPFFQNLQKQVLANSEDINDLAAGALSSLVAAFVLTARSGLALAQSFSQIRSFARDSIGAILEFNRVSAAATAATSRFQNSVFLLSDETLAKVEKNLVDATKAVDDFAESDRKADLDAENFIKTLDGLNTGLSDLERLTTTANLAAALPEIQGGPTASDLTGNSDKEIALTKDQIKEQRALEKAKKDLLALTRQITLEGIDGADRQRFLIDEQIARVKTLTSQTGDQALQERLVNDLLERRAAIGQGGDNGNGGSAIKKGISDALKAGINEVTAGGNPFQSLGQSLSDTLKKNSQKGLEDGFKDLIGGLGEAFSPAFDSIASTLSETFGPAFDGISEEFGAALGAALQFAASLALDAILGNGGNKSSSSSGNVTSAVTSSAAVRGIVAGPQEIAIAQVDQAIADSIEPLLQEARIHTGQFSRMISSIQSSGGTVSSIDEISQTVATSSAPLAAI